MKTKNEILGARVKDLRIQCKFTQECVAQFAFTTKQTISRIERVEKARVSDKVLAGLSNVFGCTNDYLLGKVDEPNKKIINGAIFNQATMESFPDVISSRIYNLSSKNIKLVWAFLEACDTMDSRDLKMTTKFFESLSSFKTLRTQSIRDKFMEKLFMYLDANIRLYWLTQVEIEQLKSKVANGKKYKAEKHSEILYEILGARILEDIENNAAKSIKDACESAIM